MKGPTEGKVRDALKAIDLEMIVYKPPDDARNWKPCDFIVFRRGQTTFIEVKENKAAGVLAIADVRPSQRLGIHQAENIGIPYWLVVWWPGRKLWSLSDAGDVLEYAEETREKSVSFQILTSRLGVEASQAQLPSMLKQLILGGVR